MLGSVVRSAVAVLLGLLAAMFFIIGVEGVCSILYPFPPGVDPSDLEACRAHVATLPASAFLIAVAGWALATFAGSWVATRLGAARHPAHGIVLGAVLLAAAVVNMLMLPYPIWFWILNLVVFPTCFCAGARLGRGRPSAGRIAVA